MLVSLLLTCCCRSVKMTEASAQLTLIIIPLLPPVMCVRRMSVQAEDTRAKVIDCQTLDDKQKAKMLCSSTLSHLGHVFTFTYAHVSHVAQIVLVHWQLCLLLESLLSISRRHCHAKGSTHPVNPICVLRHCPSLLAFSRSL